ncbi:MAG: hypothetical protein LBN25_04950, partial [Christensenellaceae bacterium]|nr:hypothetical protein [Christensenellaceae bacterium]
LDTQNDLYGAALSLCPGIKVLTDILKQAGFTDVSMTGSGSGIFAKEKDTNKFTAYQEACESIISSANLPIKLYGLKTANPYRHISAQA